MSSLDCLQPHAPTPPAPADGHAHSHSHGAGHSHVHIDPASHRPEQRRALVLCIALTAAMMVVEIVGSWWTGSLMLLSDAAHMLSHAVALGISYVALRLAGRAPSDRTHYGWYRAEILAAFLNGLGVLVLSIWIAVEAVHRFQEPRAIEGPEMTLIALLGLAVNVATAFILGKAGATDLNTKSAFLHMLGDTLSSVAIVVGGLVLWGTGWMWIDPALSLLVTVVVLIWGFGLLRESTSILLERTPKDLDTDEVRTSILSSVPEIVDVHDLHIWEITSGYVCLTAHVVVSDLPVSETHVIHEAAREHLRQSFGVGHVTLQFESH